MLHDSNEEEFVDLEDTLADLDLVTIPKEVEEYARNNVRETEETKCVALAELTHMIYEKGDTKPVRMDDAFLLRFLRARNYRVEPTFRLFSNYHKFRENNPSYYREVNPLKLEHIGDKDILNVLPYRDQNGRRMMVLTLGCWNPNDADIEEVFKAILACLQLGILEPRAQILGGVVIFDLEGFGLQQALQVTPSVATKVLDLMGVSFPMKTAAIHIINTPRVFDMVFNVFKQFLGSKYHNLIHNHGNDFESLHNFIEPKYLPQKYGGIRRNYSYREWFVNLSTNQKIIEELKSSGYTNVGEEDKKEVRTQ